MTLTPLAANAILEDWNRLEQETATEAILPCNGSRAWAVGVVNRYPFDTPEQLFTAADEVWRGLSARDWQQAFDSHPRIGETHAKAASAKSETWSAGEQAKAQSKAQADPATAEALAEGNRQYEAKFGRIFIVCATGKSAAEILAILRHRLGNDAATELHEAAEQQRQITQLRLRKWLDVPAGGCA